MSKKLLACPLPSCRAEDPIVISPVSGTVNMVDIECRRCGFRCADSAWKHLPRLSDELGEVLRDMESLVVIASGHASCVSNVEIHSWISRLSRIAEVPREVWEVRSPSGRRFAGPFAYEPDAIKAATKYRPGMRVVRALVQGAKQKAPTVDLYSRCSRAYLCDQACHSRHWRPKPAVCTPEYTDAVDPTRGRCLVTGCDNVADVCKECGEKQSKS